MRRTLLTALVLLVIAWDAASQKRPLPFLIAYEKEKAYLIVAEVPRGTYGFTVYRKSGDDFELLTPEPVVTEKDPSMFRTLVGSDYAWISKALKARSEMQTMRRVQTDAGTAFAFSIASLGVARAVGRLFVDSTAREGEEYTYRVVFVDAANKEVRRRERTAEMERIIPSPPAELTAKDGDGKVKITWNYPAYEGDPDDITVGFCLYRSDAGGEPHRISEGLALRQEGVLSRIDATVENGKTYVYTVRAVDVIGRMSEPSEQATVVPRDNTAPGAPVEFTATPKEGKIVLAWRRGPEQDLSHYDVYRGSAAQGDFGKVNTRQVPVDMPAFVDSNIVFGPYYVYRVKSVDRSGNESRFSVAVTARPVDSTPPLAPMDLSAIVTGRSVTLRWRPSLSDDAMGYYIYRGFRPNDMLRMVGTPIPTDTPTFLDTGFRNKGLSPGAKYLYAVSAIDSAQNESQRMMVNVSIPDDDPPAPPFNVRVSTGRYGVIEIGWQPSPSTDVSAFRVYRSDGISPQKILASIRGYTYNDSSVVRGRTYTYQVCAVDSSENEGVKSPEISVISKSVYLAPAPSAVEAVVSPHGVSLKWSSVDPRELEGYNVYRLDRATGSYQKLNAEPLKAVNYLDRGGISESLYKVTSVTTSGHENTS